MFKRLRDIASNSRRFSIEATAPGQGRLSGSLLTLLGAIALSHQAAGQCQPQWLPVDGVSQISGTVRAMTMWDPDGPGPLPARLVVGGNFTITGFSAPNIAMWDGMNWSPLGTGTNYSVMSLGVLATGELLAGGEFTIAGGNPASCIAKWDGTSWSALGGGLNTTVQALATLPNGDIVAGGSFWTAEGHEANGLAHWNGAAWSGFGVATSARVKTFCTLSNGDLVAGGYFANTDGSNRNLLLRWNGVSWTPFAPGLASSGVIYSLATLANGDVVAGGSFLKKDGAPSDCVARWNGSSWIALDAGLSGKSAPSVQSLAVLKNGHVVAAGVFTNSGSVTANRVAEWNGSAWSALESGMDQTVYSLLVQSSGTLLAGGSYSFAGASPAKNIASWDGTHWSALGTWITGDVKAFATMPNGDIVIGGTTTNGYPVLRWNGATWSSIGNERWQGADVRSLAVLANGDVIAGGNLYLDPLGPVEPARRNIVRWDGTKWRGMGIYGLDFNKYVNALAVLPNGDLVAGGSFTYAAERPQEAKYVARWNGASWSAMGKGLNGWVQALHVEPDGTLIAGGNMENPDFPADRIRSVFRWDGKDWIAFSTQSTPKPNPLNLTNALGSLSSGELVAAGTVFRLLDPFASRALLARWDGSIWSPLGNAYINANTYDNDIVYALATLPNGAVVVGGVFSAHFPLTIQVGANIARWNGIEWSPLGAGVGYGVYALKAHPSGEILVGGSFSQAGGKPANRFARWTDNPKPWVAIKPIAQTFSKDASISISSTPASAYSNVAYQWRRNGADLSNGPGGASPGGGFVSGASGTLDSPTSGIAATLSIDHAQPSDTGEYTIVFFNSCGGASSTATQTIRGCASDLNGNNLVDDPDFVIFVVAYDVLNCTDPAMPIGCPADLNGDGVVDDADFTVFVKAYYAMLCE